MKKLWDKGVILNQEIENFTVGEDPILDINLIVYDCLGSIAHAYMLFKIGLLTQKEFKQLKDCLITIINQNKNFVINKADEDVHTAVENYLTEGLGDLGKKIHTARSRNDQVMLDLRLYMRENLLEIMTQVLELVRSLLKFAQEYKDTPIAGRTHFQKAMPSSFGLWAGAFAESILDNLTILKNGYDIINQSPLGSAAAYGVNLPIDRQLVADMLGFSKVQNNVLYVSNSRGKFESIVIHALSQVFIDLSKISTDLIFFSAPEFGYVSIPEELCTGSSLMPQKKNPCGLELVRAKSARVVSNLFQTIEIIRYLPSGYNRDFQETKRPLMDSFQTTLESIKIMRITIDKLKVNKDACLKSLSPDLFATDRVLELVNQGVPFRDAYRQVASQLDDLSQVDAVKNIANKTHVGATGNLGLELSNKKIAEFAYTLDIERKRVHAALSKLLEA